MDKKQLAFIIVCAAVVIAGVVIGGDFFSGMTYLADPKPGG